MLLLSVYFTGLLIDQVKPLLRRGSPLVVGVKSKTKMTTDRFPIVFGKGKTFFYTFVQFAFRIEKHNSCLIILIF